MCWFFLIMKRARKSSQQRGAMLHGGPWAVVCWKPGCTHHRDGAASGSPGCQVLPATQPCPLVVAQRNDCQIIRVGSFCWKWPKSSLHERPPAWSTFGEGIYQDSRPTWQTSSPLMSSQSCAKVWPTKRRPHRVHKWPSSHKYRLIGRLFITITRDYFIFMSSVWALYVFIMSISWLN